MMLTTVQVSNLATGEVLYQEDGTEDVPWFTAPWYLLEYLRKVQMSKNFLGLEDGDFIDSFGITALSAGEHRVSSAEPTGSAPVIHTGPNTCVLLGNGSELKQNSSYTIHKKDGSIVDSGIKLRIEARENGLVLNLGITGRNVLGQENSAYFVKMTSRRMKIGSLSGARVFDSWQKLCSNLAKYQEEFKAIVRKNPDMYLSVETLGSGAKEYQSRTDYKKKTDELLWHINAAAAEAKEMVEESLPIPSCEPTDSMMESETEYRMEKLGLWRKIISQYRKTGKVYQSEGPGILFDLDSDAQEAVKSAQSYGWKVYHVIKTEFEFGPVYDVLYTSRDTDDWTFERPNSDGVINSYCWIPQQMTADNGEIQVTALNGGLKRVG